MHAIYRSSNLIEGGSTEEADKAMQELKHLIEVTKTKIEDGTLEDKQQAAGQDQVELEKKIPTAATWSDVVRTGPPIIEPNQRITRSMQARIDSQEVPRVESNPGPIPSRPPAAGILKQSSISPSNPKTNK